MSVFSDPFANRRRVIIFSVIAVAIWILTVILLIQESRPTHKRVVLIVIDGLRADALRQIHRPHLPAFNYLINNGAATLNARTDVHDTKALPNTVSIVTGRPVYDTQAAHGYRLNGYMGQAIHDVKKAYVHSIFDVLYLRDYRAAFFASKSMMGLFIKSYTTEAPAGNIFTRQKNPSRFQSYAVTNGDQQTFENFMLEFRNYDARLIFLHFAGPETVGRAAGWDTDSIYSPYMQEIVKIDGYLAEILKAGQRVRHLRGNVYLILTASHGGSELPDQFQVRENFTVPFLVWGPDISRGADLYALNASRRRDPGKYLIPYDRNPQPIRNAEAGNLALKLLDLSPVPSSIINGLQRLRVTDEGNP